MIELRRIDHVCLRVRDLDAAVGRWSVQFGLTEASREPGRALLRCGYEPYSLELVEADDPGFDHAGWELGRTVTLDAAAAELDRHGVDHERIDGRVRLSDPDGYGIELVPFRVGGRPASAGRPRDRGPAGLRPRKLGHVNVLTTDLDTVTAFYTEVLGMRLSDRLLGAGNWLHVNSDHHALALVRHGLRPLPPPGLRVRRLGRAAGHCSTTSASTAAGSCGARCATRLARTCAAYVRVPEEELIVEPYCDMEQLERDHEPRDWPDDPHSSNAWGILPPRSYFRFDAEAIR